MKSSHYPGGNDWEALAAERAAAAARTEAARQLAARVWLGLAR